MGGAELGGLLEPGLLDVDGDDGAAVGGNRGEQRGQAHRSHPENNDRGTGFGPQCVQDGAGTGLNAAAEGTEQFQGQVARHLHAVLLVGDGVGRPGRLAEEVATNRFLAVGQGGGAVEAGPDEVELDEFPAVHRHVVFDAVVTHAAEVVGEHHVITRGDGGDLGSDCLDDAGSLVAQHNRRLIGSVARDDAQIGVADSGSDDPHEHLVRAQIVDMKLFQREGAVGGAQNSSGGVYQKSSFLVGRVIGAGTAGCGQETAFRALFRVMVWLLVYSASPCREFSAPIPDCLCPPNTWCGEYWCTSLSQTVPASS